MSEGKKQVHTYRKLSVSVAFYSNREGFEGEYAAGSWWHRDRGFHSSSVTSVRVPSECTSTREMRLTITISNLSAPTLLVCTPWLLLWLRIVCVDTEIWPAPLEPVCTALSSNKSLVFINGEVATVQRDWSGTEGEVAMEFVVFGPMSMISGDFLISWGWGEEREGSSSWGDRGDFSGSSSCHWLDVPGRGVATPTAFMGDVGA